MKRKVTYIISPVDKAIAFEWISEQLDKAKFELSFVLLNNERSYLEDYLKASGIKVLRIGYRSKKNLPSVIVKLIAFLKKNRTEIVHAHLFEASLAGLMAAKLCGIKKRIYTRHYSTYHHHYFPGAVKWDKLINWLATDIVAICKIVFDVLALRENVRTEKISVIYHGFKLSDFSEKNSVSIDRLNALYNPLAKRPVIGLISRFTELKGIQYVIPAFKKILADHPNALLLLFNASGDYEKEIDALLRELPAGSYQKIAFENSITSLYHLFDIFLHVPINSSIEAFGQTYIECLASRTPLIATRSGIGNEILEHNYNALVVPYQDSESIYTSINTLLNDRELCHRLTENGVTTVQEKFQITEMIRKLEILYLQ